MSVIEQQVVYNLQQLPLEIQKAVLEFTEFLALKHDSKRKKRRNIGGLWADLEIEAFDESELKTLRREAWKSFPREIAL